MATATQTELAETFRRLHVKGSPLVLFNIWDAGTARVVEGAGAMALATGSWSVAEALGYRDGQAVPLSLAMENLARIIASVTLPVSVDLESGYGDAPEAVGATMARAIGGEGLYRIGDQCVRIEAACEAADRARIPAFVNARTDIFLKAAATQHDDRLGNEALHRALAYAESGASGFFVPGLVDERLIERLCAACPLPVNIMMSPTAPSPKRLAELGVARISHGPGPYRQMMKLLEDAARRVYGSE
ncbi:MAG: isocitrate lyase/phosphoenolpyruvate mutase family protein [Usitatibacteraceae bacterium]